jgi:acetyl esterase/lipase
MKNYDPNDPLRFDPSQAFEERTMAFVDGRIVKYRAYENIYYVTNVVDPAYQYLNFYVPEPAYKNSEKTPIFLKINVGGWLASKASPSLMNIDASGRALIEGYVVVVPGCRGSNSTITAPDGKVVYTGMMPAAITDLKAVIRYLRHNDSLMPGSAERIITDGTSAGGALSALLGVTGNNPLYEPYLKELGAADERDDIFAAVCFCPITDQEHASMAYEWLYGVTNNKTRTLTPEQVATSDELKSLYPAYLDNLGLKKPDGTSLTCSNYKDFIKSLLIQSAQRARSAGADIPDNIGVTLSADAQGSPADIVRDVDLDVYLKYIAAIETLKLPPAFDWPGGNKMYGDEFGKPQHVTDYSLRRATGNPNAKVDPAITTRVYLMNPMNFIGNGKSNTARNWYIRHGAIDRDTAFQVPINLYLKLLNNGNNVDFALAWNRSHRGDYDLDALFSWIGRIVENADKQ